MLRLTFSTRAGRALLSCDQDSTKHLQMLKGRYASSTSINNQAFDLEIDELLVNLQELSNWPAEDPDVEWDVDLLRLLETNAADAQVLERRLSEARTSVLKSPHSLDSSWDGLLTDFQLRDLGKLCELGHGANFSVPGAGKTRVTLAVFQDGRTLGKVRRMLVVCPKSAFESWKGESEICFRDSPLKVEIMDDSTVPFADIILINYERLPDARAALINWLRAESAMLVLDEAHRMKLGPAGAWGRACYALGPWAVRRLILSGTPAPNGAKDLENLFTFVWPGLGRATVVGALSGGDLRTASQRLRPLFTRTTKKELDLPPVDISVRRLDLPPLHRNLYDALLGQVSGQWSGDEQNLATMGRVVLYLLMAATTPALLATGASRYEPLPYRIPPIHPAPGSTLEELMRDLPHYELSPKYQEVLAIVNANASIGRKTLVWSTFVRNLKSLEHLLSNYSPAIVHGGSEDRAEQLTRFRKDPNCWVLLSNPATLGEGVSLHDVCHDAVYLDRDFAAGRFLQSLDRIHRLGLKPDVKTRIVVLVANQTIDELVEVRLASKLNFMGRVLDDAAVLELGDLDEEPTEAVGMDQRDLQALIAYLKRDASS
jgi:SNF2 family DNA or RNA helicase